MEKATEVRMIKTSVFIDKISEINLNVSRVLISFLIFGSFRLSTYEMEVMKEKYQIFFCSSHRSDVKKKIEVNFKFCLYKITFRFWFKKSKYSINK